MRLIDADELKKKAKMIDWLCNKQVVSVEDIDNAPTVEERQKGEWIYKRVDPQRCGNIHGCNICGQEVQSFSTDYQNRPCVFNFCPSCGADMRGDKE